MPRWASRVTLEVTGVRVERVQDISISDILKEGYQHEPGGYASENWPDAAWGWFELLWDSINAKKYPWASNPWGWVVEFRRTK